MTAPTNHDQPVILSADLLEELAARWRAQGMPIIESLRPGLGDAEMDALTEPLDITLPREARTWWGWHDGAASRTSGVGSANLGPLRLFAPLSDAVRATAETRDIMRGVDGELDSAWQRAWLMMAAGGDTVVIDCGVKFDAPVPARYYRFEEPETGAGGVPSIGSLVVHYIDAFDRGAWAYDREHGVWRGDALKADPATRHLHLT
jgi:hypothetical protein